MTTKRYQGVWETILVLLVVYFFYEGIYNLVYFQVYGSWLFHAPLLRPISSILKYAIPITELSLALGLLVPRLTSYALVGAIIVSVVYILWIMSSFLFTSRIFIPFHALWNKPTWMQMMTIALCICWLAFAALMLSRRRAERRVFIQGSLK